MSIIGTTGAQSVAGVQQAEAKAAKDIDRKRKDETKSAREVRDEVELTVEQLSAVDAVRNLKDNSQEETHEDREEHNHYLIARRQEQAGEQLDVEG